MLCFVVGFLYSFNVPDYMVHKTINNKQSAF